jgi:hypothetical protein
MEIAYRGKKKDDTARFVYHTIEKCDYEAGMFNLDLHIEGVPDANVHYAIRECMGRIQKNDIGRILRFKVTGLSAHCRISAIQGE